MIYILLAILWMAVIFRLSADPADASSEKSFGIGYAVANMFVPGFDDWQETRQQEFVKGIEHPIRKAGHATEYAILGFLCMGAWFRFYAKQKKKMPVIALVWGIATLYAASDEFHQLFVPGRSCQFSDVCLDSVGIVAGIAFYFLGQRLFKRLFP